MQCDFRGKRKKKMSESLNPYASPKAAPPAATSPPTAAASTGTPHERLRLAFEIREEDWVVLATFLSLFSPFARQRQRRLHGAWGQVRPLIYAVPVLILLTYLWGSLWGFAGGRLMGLLPLWVFLGLYVLRALWAPRVARRYVVRYAHEVLRAGRNRVLLGPQELEVGPEGWTLRSHVHQTSLRWEALETVAVVAQHVVLMWSPTAGAMVPSRALANESEIEDLVATCLRYAPDATLDRIGG